MSIQIEGKGISYNIEPHQLLKCDCASFLFFRAFFLNGFFNIPTILQNFKNQTNSRISYIVSLIFYKKISVCVFTLRVQKFKKYSLIHLLNE